MVTNMNVAIFGATGGVGTELVRQALRLGHSVTAFARDPSPLADHADHLTIVTGDVRDPADVARAVRGQDAVLCALGARDLKKTTIRATGTANIIGAMKQEGVRRLIVVSAMGIGASWASLSLFNRMFFATLLRSSRADHEAQEAVVTASGLDWTIVRPSGLVNTPGTGVYDVGENIRATTSRIPRADVADLILTELAAGALIHKAVTITT
ncbi:MAG: SDR family oxidoreductase [Spirochaetaceae bacterium]|nr:MAG: SDR family oxidoreductase [Spirochaetaceae bacterium]